MILGVSENEWPAAVIALSNVAILLLQRRTNRKVEEAKEVAAAPRRFVYNEAGAVIGSVPEAPRSSLRYFEPIREGNGQRWHETEEK